MGELNGTQSPNHPDPTKDPDYPEHNQIKFQSIWN
jgi:hypothetical protein